MGCDDHWNVNELAMFEPLHIVGVQVVDYIVLDEHGGDIFCILDETLWAEDRTLWQTELQCLLLRNDLANTNRLASSIQEVGIPVDWSAFPCTPKRFVQNIE